MKHFNLVPRVFVPLDQRSENESSGKNHFEVTKGITEFSRSLHLWRMPEIVAPRALDSCRRPEGSWALEARMKRFLEPNRSVVLKKYKKRGARGPSSKAAYDALS